MHQRFDLAIKNQTGKNYGGEIGHARNEISFSGAIRSFLEPMLRNPGNIRVLD